MEKNYTPGPWEACGLRVYAGKVKIAVPFDKDLIELYGKLIADPQHEYPDCETAIANARLIALAPELVEALEDAYSLAVSDRYDGDTVAARIRTLLSRVRGEAVTE